MSNDAGAELAGRVALVTGGSSGIGRAVCLRLAEAGATVIVADLRDEPREGGTRTHELITSAGGRAMHRFLDVCSAEQVDSVVGEVADEHGLDILVCAAGQLGPTGDFLDLSLGDLDRHLAVNFRGVFACNQAALRTFVSRRGGKIVNIASNFGFVGVEGMAVYCSVKAAVLNLTRSLAVEFGRYGINVNALCPGLTATALNAELRGDPAMHELFERETPLRMGESGAIAAEPRDMAEAALFLASDRARFATGTCLVVDGGWIAH